MIQQAIDKLRRELAVRSGWAQRRFAGQQGCFRILTYHNLIADRLADRQWVPSHAVTVSQFRRQMAMLAELDDQIVHPLQATVERTFSGDAPDRPAVCLTFDDGTADNVELAMPILREFGLTATFFLTTGHIDRGQLLVNDVIRILRAAHAEGRIECPPDETSQAILSQPDFPLTRSLFTYQGRLLDLWRINRYSVDQDAAHCLRIMTWNQARALRDAGMGIGAHTVNHVILANEDPETRRHEISESVNCIQQELGLQHVPFCYPNGQRGDFGRHDIELLESLNVPLATTQLPGTNDGATPRFMLRRHNIGRHCSDVSFLAAVFGVAPQPAARPAPV